MGMQGQVIDAFALNVDYAPTILDAAGIPIPDVMHGRSLKPILEGNVPDDWRESAYYAYYEDSWRMYQNLAAEDLNDTTYTEYFTAHRVGPHHGVRTARYKLIEYYTENYWELFDLEEDPGELNNIYGRRDTDVLVRRLKEELFRLEELYGDIKRPA